MRETINKLWYPILVWVILFVIPGCSHSRQGHIAGWSSKLHSKEQVIHIVHMGQSLGAGEQSLPIVTDSTTGFGNLKFSLGTHTWSNSYFPDHPELRSPDGFTFVPLTAQRRGGEGETIANGMADHLSQTIRKKQYSSTHFLFSYAGQGGRLIRELDKRHDEARDPRSGVRQSKGGYYKTSIDDVARAQKNAIARGMSYSVGAITWMQGEANGTFRLSRWDSALDRKDALEMYKTDLINLYHDYQNDISSITGQSNRIPFFSYQTAGSFAGIAQLQVGEQAIGIYLVGPTYMLPNAENSHYNNGNKLVHGDGIHLTADGERWLGEQFGKVMRKVIFEKNEWQPLKPLDSWYDASKQSVNIRFHVPNPPLVIDTLFLPKQTSGYGFVIYDEQNKVHDILKVTTVANDVITFILKQPINTGSRLFVKYAQTAFVSDVSQRILEVVSEGKNEHGHESIGVVFEGDIQREFAILKNEGVFYLSNKLVNDSNFTNLIIRNIHLNNDGNTVLSGDKDELRNNIKFRNGQRCYVSRRFSYGNLRDSDSEKSVFTFKDSTYGNRSGQFYPLYNWCVAFLDLPVSFGQFK